MSNETNINDLTLFKNLSIENTTNDNGITSIVTQIDDKGIGILFTYIEDESSTIEAAITDNYVETNHSVQDHIAIKPKMYRLRGCVGEVVYKGSNEWIRWIGEKINSNPILSKTLNAMKPIKAISGVVSNATESAIAIVNQLESSYNRYRKMIENSFFNRQSIISGKMQESVVADLNRILELRIPVNLKGLMFEKTLTDGDNYERKYYLQSVSAHQGNNAFITDIEVTIKEFRVATTQVTKVDKTIAGQQNNSAIAKSQEVNTGNKAGQNPSEKAKEEIKNTVLDTAKENIRKSVLYEPYKAVKNNKFVQRIGQIIKTDLNARKGITKEDYINGTARQKYKQQGGLF